MRISTGTLYDRATQAMLDRQSAMSSTQQQLATGRRVVLPSDDPAAAAEAVSLTSDDARIAQYGRNTQSAMSRLSLSESTLGSLGDVLQRARELAPSAGNGSYDDAARRSIATELRAQLGTLLSLANSVDPATGRPLFGGTAPVTAPYAKSGGSYVYHGDQGHIDVPVSDNLELRSSIHGFEVFEGVRDGNGVFTAGAAATNTGTGIVHTGRVVDTSLATGDQYALRFSVAAGVTTYDVVDTTTGAIVAAAQPYAAGQPIAFDGLETAVTGAPADGDVFTVAPSTVRNVFDTLSALADLLEQPVASAGDRTRVQQGLKAALAHIDAAHERMLVVRAEVGARMQQADSMLAVNSELSIDLQARISNAQDLDYPKAISDFARQQLALEAAQRSFAMATGKSLLDML